VVANSSLSGGRPQGSTRPGDVVTSKDGSTLKASVIFMASVIFKATVTLGTPAAPAGGMVTSGGVA